MLLRKSISSRATIGRNEAESVASPKLPAMRANRESRVLRATAARFPALGATIVGPLEPERPASPDPKRHSRTAMATIPAVGGRELKVSAEGPTRLQHDQPGCHRTASIVYVDSPATLINIRNRTATSASTITLTVQIRTSHPMRRGQQAVRTEGCSTIT